MLNAFRHQRTIHRSYTLQPDSRQMCSTPFGINERFTIVEAVTLAVTSLCSTPFGINERFTNSLTIGANAITGAQRLSASTNDSQSWGSRSPPASLGAQRLSASTNDSQSSSARSLHRQSVLNAFRHQRTIHRSYTLQPDSRQMCSTPFGINERFTIVEAVTLAVTSLCSTPFGINERFTTLSQPIVVEFECWCSTPFGINERFTDSTLTMIIGVMPCSTPFGINERFTKNERTLIPFLLMCSTPFGINERFTDSTLTMIIGVMPCSTPFGINERFTLTAS